MTETVIVSKLEMQIGTERIVVIAVNFDEDP